MTATRIRLAVLILSCAVCATGCGDDNGPVGSIDGAPPAAVGDLATTGATDSSVTLTWTAPGDDGSEGTASEYDLRYALTEITEATWDSAQASQGEPSPRAAGETESSVVTGLLPDTTYFFALRSADEVSNVSDLSNVASGRTEQRPAVYFLKPDGTGDFPTIMDAVAAAQPGDVIELDDGIFTGDGNRDIEFLGKDLILRSRSGRPEDCIIDCAAGLQDPHRGFRIAAGETPAALIEGITIENGVLCATCDQLRGGASPDAGDGGLHDLSGAGIKIQEASPTVRNCIIRNCQSEFTGGGLSIEFDSFPLIENCLIHGNGSNQEGGGITVENFSGPVIRDCVIAGNTAQSGGGVGITRGTDATLEGCLITGNVARDAAGILVSGATSSALVTGTTIAGNRANSVGGGLAAFLGGPPVLDGCVIYGNCVVGQKGFLPEDITIDALSDSLTVLTCCVIDSAAVVGVPTYGAGNVFGDPAFCGPVSCEEAPSTEGDYGVMPSSPCLPANNDCGQLIGALGACGSGIFGRSGVFNRLR